MEQTPLTFGVDVDKGTDAGYGIFQDLHEFLTTMHGP